MSLASGGAAGGRRRRSRRLPLNSEINVTPFVDVMLVLLIVFMVAAPLLTVGVPIELPETQAKELNSDVKPIMLSVRPGGEVYLQDSAIPLDELSARLTAIAKSNDKPIFVRGDKAATYGDVLRVMGHLNGAGFRKIGLVGVPDAG